MCGVRRPAHSARGYLQLLDWSSRLLRDRSRMFGTVFTTKRSEINRMAEARGVKKLSKLNGCSG